MSVKNFEKNIKNFKCFGPNILTIQILIAQIVISQVSGGDASGESGTSLYPLPINSLRALLEDPGLLDGKRTEVAFSLQSDRSL